MSEMARAKSRVLVVDDEPTMTDFLVKGLSRRGFEVEAASSGAAALLLIGERDFDVVVTDLNMKGLSGVELCQRVVARRPDVPVVLITAFGSMEVAISAIRAGAYDFLTKPFELDAMVLVLNRAAEHRALRAEVRRLRDEASAAPPRSALVGESVPMAQVRDLVARVARSDASVLIAGESGTGKELVARALHEQSDRADGPFVAINCAALPAHLLESELFGHVKGAFTDARADRRGLFLEADGGTLFLDELGELPLSLQPKLLRALQERKVRPLGGAAEHAFDARIVAATNRDLEQLVADGQFREDLYFRLNVISIELPPLRERGNDVLLLAQRFLNEEAHRSGKRIVGLSPEVARKLTSYAWPGNIRELRNCIERGVALARFDHLNVDDLPDRIRREASAQPAIVDGLAPTLSLAAVERMYIEKVLASVGGNRSHAARILGLDRKTLTRKLAVSTGDDAATARV